MFNRALSSRPFSYIRWDLKRLGIFTFLLASALLACNPSAQAAQVSIGWEASSGPDLAGYKLYYGTTSRSYDYSLDVGNSNSCTISGLEEGKTYYFACTAYDSDHKETGFSKETSYTVPFVPAAIPAESIYEDAEDGTTNGWVIYDASPDGAALGNVFDAECDSRVIEVKSSGTDNGFRLGNGSDGSCYSKWNNTDQFTIEWRMQFSDFFYVFVDVQTPSGRVYLYYTPEDRNKLGTGSTVHYGLGSRMTDGTWHKVVRDLEADLKAAQPKQSILSVNGFLIRGTGKIDDIRLR
jgi:hypothetical protein